jgi:hypothetical protein
MPKFSILLIIAFCFIVAVTVVSVALRSYASSTDTVYVKVKISQGLWWTNSEKPPFWVAQAINVGDSEKDLFGRTTAKVLEKRYYPADARISPNQYDIFLTLKVEAKKDPNSGAYRYKRALVAVGTPLSLDLNSTEITAAVTAMSPEEIHEKYTTKTITFSDLNAYYSNLPQEYDSIQVGDTYFDGTGYPVKIVGKHLVPRQVPFGDQFGRVIENKIQSNQTIVVEAEVAVQEIDGKYIYGEEQQVVSGANLNISTNTADLSRFVISSIK